MAKVQQVEFSGIKGVIRQPPKPRALFVKGLPDDGMIKIAADMNSDHAPGAMDGYDSATFLTRHIPGALQHFASIPGLANETIVIAGSKNQTLKFTIPRVIVNCMTDADRNTKALAKLEDIVANIKAKHGVDVPVVNPPAGILRTSRDKIYEQFKHLTGMVVPRVIRMAPNSVADVVQQVAAQGIRLPFLIRQAGRHSGKGLQVITSWSPEELLKLERYAYDGSEYYITEWVDFVSPSDKLYRKIRLICVDGKYIPRHLIVTAGWDTHLRWRMELMSTRADLRQEEEAFLRTPLERSLSSDAFASLRVVHETLGLDYFGIDGSIREDGSLVVFEINAAFNAMEKNHKELYSYTNDAIAATADAFNDVIARKAALPAATAQTAHA